MNKETSRVEIPLDKEVDGKKTMTKIIFSLVVYNGIRFVKSTDKKEYYFFEYDKIYDDAKFGTFKT
jgi:hypothetical protein